MQRELNTSIIRSDTRIRESVRSLPRGHFQQIRQMFDKQACSARKLATIYERQQKSLPSHVLLHLPVTDDEKLQHTATDGTLGERYRDYVAEYQAFRAKLTNELNEHKSMYPPGKHASHQNKGEWVSAMRRSGPHALLRRTRGLFYFFCSSHLPGARGEVR